MNWEQVETQVLLAIVQAVAAVAVPYLVYQLIRVVNHWLDAHENNLIMAQAKTLVKAAMQSIVNPANLDASQAEAKAFVEAKMRIYFPTMPPDLLDPVIEAAVHEVKQEMQLAQTPAPSVTINSVTPAQMAGLTGPAAGTGTVPSNTQ